MTPQQQYELKLSAVSITNGDVEKARAIYAWLTEVADPGAAEAPAPKAEKPKAEKAKADKPKAEAPPAEKPVEKEAEQPTLSYDTDVLPRIVATVSRLTTAGADPQTAKGAIVAVMKDKFGVSSAKDIPAGKWADLIAALDTVTVG